jgi:predicted SnoaL-like aldol condensation-catalyzing enzyme
LDLFQQLQIKLVKSLRHRTKAAKGGADPPISSINFNFSTIFGVAQREKASERETMNRQFKSFRRLIISLALALMLAVFAQAILADEALTERNKAIVRDFYTTVLIGRNVDAAPRFLRPEYTQGNPGNNVPTGLKGFMDTFRERFSQKLPPDYKRELLNVVGDNDMVVVYVRQTWTGKDGKHHQALGFDMFRVQDGMITEHWDAD